MPRPMGRFRIITYRPIRFKYPPLVKSDFQKVVFQKYLKTLFFEKRFKYPPWLRAKFFNGGGDLNRSPRYTYFSYIS